METEPLSIPKIDNDISQLQNSLSSSPRSHYLRARNLELLATARRSRYMLSGRREDLDKSILHFTEALLLPFHCAARSRDIAQLLFSLARTLLDRSIKFEQPEDVKYCVQYLHYLQDQPHEVFDIPRQSVKTLLVQALAVRVKLKSGDAMQDIKEMATLCRELLDSDNFAAPPTIAITSLVQVILTRFEGWGQEPLDKVIECLQEINMHLSDMHIVSLALAHTLFFRFRATYSIDDSEEATTILDRIITSTSPSSDNISNVFQETALKMITSLILVRSAIYERLEYLEEAIFRFRAYLVQPSLEDTLRRGISHGLVLLLEKRSRAFGVGEGVQEARPSDAEIIGLSSLSSLTSSLPKPDLPSMTTKQLSQHFRALDSTARTTDITEIEEAIKYCRLLVASYHRDPGHPGAYFPARELGNLLFRAFKHTNDIEYLNESIAVHRDVLKLPDTWLGQFDTSLKLISSLSSRFRLLQHREDFDEIIQLFATVVNDRSMMVSKRFEISCNWAGTARESRHPSATAAYENAILLMQDSLSFAPTPKMHHFHLAAMRDSYEKLPLDYASYQVQTGQLQRAIETLEQGRALLWSEMRGLRTAADQLRAIDPALAEKFVEINSDLEKLTISMPPYRNMEIDGSGVEGPEGTDPFGGLVVKQQKLLEERDRLISQVRSLPGFEGFLTAPSFDTLRLAASRGPVIVINHCEWRSYILILLHESPPSLITTTNDFYDRAIELRDRLVKTRKGHRLESKQYQHALRSVLASLYELVGRPVIEKLCKLNIPEQSRVWWCPTSAFCSLPLHAMGPIPSNDGVKLYFSDLYISSYTPTLSALIESRKPGRQTSEKPSILFVVQPEFLEDADREIRAIRRLGTQVTSLMSREATPSSVVDGLRNHQFSHFLCHGDLEPGKPYAAMFKLFGDGRLTLLDIVRSRLPNAELAFLSACHTSELTEESIADEAFHLAAAMQYCGFRSVVGTMWARAGTAGKDLVEDFYNSILSSDAPGVPYYERSARALRDAVKKLRRKRRVTLEQWTNFVHYGA